MTKGTQVAVEGELRLDRWEQDGQKRSKVKIIANNVQLLGSRGGSSGGAPGSQGSQGGFQRTEGSGEVSNGGGYQDPGEGSGSFEDDIPF
jgi:single-strand DNA-binding protein